MKPSLARLFDELTTEEIEEIVRTYLVHEHAVGDSFDDDNEDADPVIVFKKESPVSARDVKRLVDQRPHDDMLCIATNAVFTSDALSFATQHDATVILIGPDELSHELSDDQIQRLSGEYASSNGATIDGSGLPGVSEDELHELAESANIHSRLLTSIFGADTSTQARLGLALQLFHGTNPLHMLLVTEAGGAPTLINSMLHMEDNAEYVNCNYATEAGLVGKYDESGRVARGLFNRMNGGLVVLDQSEAFTGDFDFLSEPLTKQQITITNGGHRATYNANMSCLAVTGEQAPENADAQSPEDILNNLPYSQIRSLFDAIVTTLDDVQPERLPLDAEELETAEPLPPDMLQQYIRFANTLEPEPSTDVNAQLQSIVNQLRERDNLEPYTHSSLTQSLIRLSKASARMRLSNIVTEEDVKIAAAVSNFGTPPEAYDSDETDTTTSEDFETTDEDDEAVPAAPATEKASEDEPVVEDDGPVQDVEEPPMAEAEASTAQAQSEQSPSGQRTTAPSTPSTAEDVIVDVLEMLQSEYSDGVPRSMLIATARNTSISAEDSELETALEDLCHNNVVSESGKNQFTLA